MKKIRKVWIYTSKICLTSDNKFSLFCSIFDYKIIPLVGGVERRGQLYDKHECPCSNYNQS